jgi:exopolyphosphatase/guanosine-5'-triphosphate,3'-diphosphate pyrophosphatase
VTDVAAIELGTHTARMLIARPTGDRRLFVPGARERRTIRLSEGFGSGSSPSIGDPATRRAADAVAGFKKRAGDEGAVILQAVSTGVTRTAGNRAAFLETLLDRTGVRFRTVSGEEEALLTARGVVHALGQPAVPFLIFDLGGGSTELVRGSGGAGEKPRVVSLPLGAALLKEAFLPEDPPAEGSLRGLALQVDRVLEKGLEAFTGFAGVPRIIGTGGTAATLAAMVHMIRVQEIGPERMNGLSLERGALNELLARMTRMPLEERTRLPGLEPGRADVIPAGALAVLRILDHFEAPRMTVCLSDILEGLLIDHLEGEQQ